jgi:hypothetical protein
MPGFFSAAGPKWGVMPSSFMTIALLSLLTACGSLDDYDPDSGDATLIEDFVHHEQEEVPGSSVVYVVQIDGIRVTNKHRRKMPPATAASSGGVALRLLPGTRKLKVRICESGWVAYCGETYLRLEALPNGRYRLRGDLSKNKGHADIWVEDMLTGENAIERVRIRGLRMKAGTHEQGSDTTSGTG